MYHYTLHQRITRICEQQGLLLNGDDLGFYTRLCANATAIDSLYRSLYNHHLASDALFERLLLTLIQGHQQRNRELRKRDTEKAAKGQWFLSNEICGMSLYVDRFCGKLNDLPTRLPYLESLGVNFLHIMPIFESPAGESDGGYAVSDFRKVDTRFGTIDDLRAVQKLMQEKEMYLMLDIVLNHTSHHHEWAVKAKKGDPVYQDYFYMYDDRTLPDQFDATMPEIFPESAPGSFTWNKEAGKWVMTVFHNYQWDLNYTNPAVLVDMLDNILFYANLGVDILRIDAPAFIWKQLGTTCQNLPEAHTILRLIRQCVEVAAPGMALLGEAIVAPKEIMKYFGTDLYTAKECDVAYNATQMALQWDALATGDTRVMLAAQQDLLQKPFGCTWISYTRCHDDIGLGYDDSMITAAGFNAYEHRKFLKEYYSGTHPASTASGALFSVNPKTQDARISGSLASLCGLERAIAANDEQAINIAIRKILLMQAQSIFLGGIPMLFYGDEAAYTNDYSYLNDEGKSYDNRWMHRPVIDWQKNEKTKEAGTIEHRIFSGTQRLLKLRKQLPVVGDYKNIRWITPHNIHVAGFIRSMDESHLYCLFNFSNKAAYLTWYAFKEQGYGISNLYDHWNEQRLTVGSDHEYLIIEPYSFCLLESGSY
ncbi:amylosucrase [Sediminibacterium goheungense]|uniref:Amylosucrase n=1 Tax=Sediminibacterium goheungense TaxID=1086393 RepID=A0A4R6J0S7_9BACT|nr:amylosucrase [Sediminibacterium goheungense]TDO28819.1 amylosucrase [Sediminibacterium goheungense]